MCPTAAYESYDMQTECLAAGAGLLDVRVSLLQDASEQQLHLKDLTLPGWQRATKGLAEVTVESQVERPGVYRVIVRIRNLGTQPIAATHTTLTLRGGEFIALTDPLREPVVPPCC